MNIDELEINNSVNIKELYDNKTWIHGKSKKDIKITVFLITIEGEQLKHSLNAINNLDTNIPVIVNVIMNVSPTNKAYNEMRLRCITEYFIQNDEDMELYSNIIYKMYNTIKTHKKKIFLHAYKLIDNILGIGDPPIIDCLKLYNNEIMKKYPTFNNGNEDISSVDSLWHKPILHDGFAINNTGVIAGYHGNNRTNFDLLLRYCKILKSVVDPRIKTNSGHICKFIKAISNDEGDPVIYLQYIINVFSDYNNINEEYFNNIIEKLNKYLPQTSLDMYNVSERYFLQNFKFYNKSYKNNKITIGNHTKFYALVALLCIVTNNYGYSKDKYPYKYYDYFKKNIVKQ